MQIRGLLVAALLLVVLGGAVWWSSKTKKDDASTAATESPKILALKEDDLRKIELRRSGGETTILERADGGEWKITAPVAYAVDKDAVSSLVTALAKLEAEKLVEEKAADFAPYGLKDPSFYVLLHSKDGKLSTVLIGDDTPTGGGFFARLAGDARLYTIAGFTKTNIDKKASDLRDKRLLTVDQSKLARFEISSGAGQIELGKNNQNEWQILKPQPGRADGWQVEEILGRLRDAKIDPNVSEDEQRKNAAAFSSAAPVATVRLTDAAGTQTLEVRKAKDGKYLAKSSAVEGTHSLAAEAGDGLSKKPEDFRNRKLFDFGFSDPGRVEYKDAEQTRAFVKAGERWLESNKPMDTVGVQSLIDRLRDLSATGFPSSGFTQGEMDLTVVSNEGKRTEKVAIGRSGDKWVARREGEPAWYGLEANVVDELKKAAKDVKEAQPPKTPEKKK